jgi:hypothetical protein
MFLRTRHGEQAYCRIGDGSIVLEPSVNWCRSTDPRFIRAERGFPFWVKLYMYNSVGFVSLLYVQVAWRSTNPNPHASPRRRDSRAHAAVIQIIGVSWEIAGCGWLARQEASEAAFRLPGKATATTNELSRYAELYMYNEDAPSRDAVG